MSLKVYVDRISEPSRAVLLFCKLNGIEFEEVHIDLVKREQCSPAFEEINPVKQVPAIVHGTFKLSESQAILRYLASVFPQVADHWYPSEAQKRAKVESVLDWHHTNLRRGSVDYVLNSTVAPALGLPLNPQVAAQGQKVYSAALAMIDSHWLQKDASFLLGNSQPSIADICLVCEILQLEVVDEKERNRMLSPHKNVVKWIDATKRATAPHFDDIHQVLYVVKGLYEKQRSAEATT